MSEIVNAFGGTASVTIGTLIESVGELDAEASVDSLTGEFSNVEVKLAVIHLNRSISDKAGSLNTVYTTIENSKYPVEYFDDKSVEELKNADALLLTLKERLQTLYDRLLRNIEIGSEALQYLMAFRRTVAKFHYSVMNLISLNKQLRISKCFGYKPKLAMNDDLVKALKKTTTITVRHYLAEIY